MSKVTKEIINSRISGVVYHVDLMATDWTLYQPQKEEQ